MDIRSKEKSNGRDGKDREIKIENSELDPKEIADEYVENSASEKGKDDINDSKKNQSDDEISVEKTPEREIEELKDKLLRKSAEMENMRRRVLKEKNDLILYSNQALFEKLLPIMDDFEKAIDAGKVVKENQSLLEGIKLIYNNAVKIFADAGVKKMDVKPGDEFDVDYHEALMQMPSGDIEEGKIIQVALVGYIYNDKVIRHAKVITSAGSGK